jgi:hypothetical protein
VRPSGWPKAEKVIVLAKKTVVKVVMSQEQRELLALLAERLGTSESEVMRLALMDYVKELSLMSEVLHRKKPSIGGTEY